MKSFPAYLFEAFYDTIKITDTTKSNYEQKVIEVFRNPDQNELKQIESLSPTRTTCRGFVDKIGNLYIWDGNIWHTDVLSRIKILDQDTADNYDSESVELGVAVEITDIDVYVSTVYDIESKLIKKGIRRLFELCKKRNSSLDFHIEEA